MIATGDRLEVIEGSPLLSLEKGQILTIVRIEKQQPEQALQQWVAMNDGARVITLGCRTRSLLKREEITLEDYYGTSRIKVKRIP